MAIAVLDLDIGSLPPSLEDLEGYRNALVLLRVDGCPAGQALIPLENGRCTHLRERLLEAADSGFWESWLRAELGLARPVAGPTGSPSATVAVCTRDRTDDLERCLTALLAMPDDGQTILVVDNAPATDETQRLVSGLPRVRYVREDRPGLDVARNRAIRETTSEVIAFTDDDAAPDAQWLRALLRNFSDPLVMAVTGATMPLELESDAQVAFQRYGGFLRGFKRVTFDAGDHDPLLAWHAGAGVNMAVRRSVFDVVGPFDEALDAGTPTRAGGDSDMFRRILATGHRIVYEPQALNWHRHRRSQEELLRQLHGYEIAASAILSKALVLEHDLGSLKHLARWLRRELRAVVRAASGRPGALPLPVAAARFRGGAIGGFAYLSARRR
jgi:GT2 family glycosyltransferase